MFQEQETSQILDYTQYKTDFKLQAADTYLVAYNILLALDPDGEWLTHFQKLNAIDIRGPGQQPDDIIPQSHG